LYSGLNVATLGGVGGLPTWEQMCKIALDENSWDAALMIIANIKFKDIKARIQLSSSHWLEWVVE